MPRTLCLFPDLHGIARGKLANNSLKGTGSIGFSPGVFAKDIYGHPHLFDEFVIPVGAADMTLDIHGEDVRSLGGHRSGILFGADALVLGRVRATDGTLHRFDIRSLLEESLKQFAASDEIRVGAELEFFLLGEVDAGLPPDGQAYAFGGLSGKQSCISDILDALDAAGIDWQDLSQENERDQYEISLKHTTALEQADRIFLARMIIRYVAARHRCRATFVAVNALDMSPSNLHLHISQRSRDVDELASALQRTLHDGFCVYRPSLNSRYSEQIESFASNRSDIADGSRFSAIRVIREGTGRRVELRTPTSDANPYLTILVMLLGLMDADTGTASPDRGFEFDTTSSLEAFIRSKAAAQIFDSEGRRLFRKLKLAEYDSAKAFGSFQDERAALVKVL